MWSYNFYKFSTLVNHISSGFLSYHLIIPSSSGMLGAKFQSSTISQVKLHVSKYVVMRLAGYKTPFHKAHRKLYLWSTFSAFRTPRVADAQYGRDDYDQMLFRNSVK